jgi:cysteine desulfurase
VPQPRIYLDHAATTPILPVAREAMINGMTRWANPSSPYIEGRAAKAALEAARLRVASALGWRGSVIFTSGASEALALALGRAKGGKRFVSAVEHDAVLRAAPDADVLPIGPGFQVDRDVALRRLAEVERPVVAIQDVNPETGKGQPLQDIGPEIRKNGGILVADCAQSAGKSPLPDADMIVVSAHKLGGPPGVGALLVRDLALLAPTGGQELGYRGGTENLPAIAGFAAALEHHLEDDAMPLVDGLSNLVYALRQDGAEEVGVAGSMAWHIAALAMPGVSARAQLIQFDMRGISVSAGSACSSGSLKTSRVLAAFGVPRDLAERTIRVSVGWSTTDADLAAFADAWRAIAGGRGARAA